MDLREKLRASGFKPQVNNDEDFPAITGEYRVSVKGIKPYNDPKQDNLKTSYRADYQITEVLSGDKADGRVLSRFHRFAGTDFNGVVVTDEQAGKAVMALINDLATLAAQAKAESNEANVKALNAIIEAPSMDAMEAEFDKAVGVIGYMRAWSFVPKDELSKPEHERRKIQQFIIKTEAQLRKDAKSKAGSETTPF